MTILNKTIDYYSVEVFFHKRKRAVSNEVDRVPKIEEYSSNTIIESMSLLPEDDIYEKIKKKHPGAVYIHILEFQRQYQ